MAILPFELDIEDIAALADIVKEKELEELRLSDSELGSKIVIKARRCPPPPPPGHHMGMPPMQRPEEQPSPRVQITPPSPPEPARETAMPLAKRSADNVVKAPIIGTYYASPAPGKPPFVTIGKKVKKGDTLMIIESMKLMNEIQSDFEGEVKEIMVTNGSSVEFDQPIMIIG